MRRQQFHNFEFYRKIESMSVSSKTECEQMTLVELSLHEKDIVKEVIENYLNGTLFFRFLLLRSFFSSVIETIKKSMLLILL